jgi:hypothetical protein
LQRKGCNLASEAQAQYLLKFDYAIDKGVLKTSSVAEYHPGETTYTRGTVTGSSGTSTYTETNQNPGHTYFRPVSYMVYTRTLKTELTRGKEPVWIGETVSYGEENDLRLVMDYLLVSNLKYLGKNTPNARIEAFTENSKEVKELRSGK